MLIHCLLVLPLFEGALGLDLVLIFITLCPSSFAIILMGKRAGRFTLDVFMMSCDCKCCVALPHGAVCIILVFPYHTHLNFL